MAKCKIVKKSFKKPGAGWWQRMPASAPANSSALGMSGTGVGTPSGASPTVSQAAGSQLGPCLVCGKLGHFKKSCPVWVRAQSAAASTS